MTCLFSSNSVECEQYGQIPRTELSLVLSLSSDQTSTLCFKHELLSNEVQIPGKQELNQTYYIPRVPLLHSAFFTLTLISPWAINEIYHWHQLGRGEKKGRAKMYVERENGGPREQRACATADMLITAVRFHFTSARYKN